MSYFFFTVRSVFSVNVLKKTFINALVKNILNKGAYCLPIFLFCVILHFNVTAQTKTSTGTGNWNTAGTWSPSGVPGAGDSVIIASGHIVTVNVNAVCGVVNIIGRLNFDITSNRTFTTTSSSGRTGNVRMSGNIYGYGNPATGQKMVIGGSFFGTNLTYSNSPGVYELLWEFNGTGNQTFSHTDDFGKFIINSPTLNLVANSSVVMSSDIHVMAGTLDLSTYTLNRWGLGGSLTLNAGSTIRLGASAGGQTGSNFPDLFQTMTLNSTSTVEYYGTNQTVYTGVTYSNLTLSGSGEKSITLSASSTLTNGILNIKESTKASITNNNILANELYFNGIPQLTGTWGSTASSASNKTNTWFSSSATGYLNVQNFVCFPPSAPTGSASQNFCSGAKVAHLIATGSDIKWYASSSGGVALATSTQLVNATTYYATQTVNNCESVDRFAATVTINSNPLSGIQNIVCQNETVTYSIPCSYDSLVWTITGGTPTSSSSPTINVTWGTGNRGWVKVEKFYSGVSQGIDSAKVYIDQVSQYVATPDTTICNGNNINLSLNYTNKSLQFNGTTDYVSIANSNLINLLTTDYRTVMLSFKANDINTRQVLYNEGGSVNGFSIYIQNGNVYCLAWEDNTAWTPVYTAINVGQWYHICFVFDQNATDGTHFKGYLNGSLISSFNEGSKAADGVKPHSGSVEIGSNLANIRFHDNSLYSNQYFNGKIDGFKLWNRALSASEIPLEQYHWLTTPVIDAALDVYINFDNNVLDQANPPSGEDGALYGSPVYSDDVPLSPSLLWTPGNLTTQSISISPSTTTNYKVKLTEQLSNYCADSTTILVTVNSTMPTITGSTPATRCGVGTLNLSATASAGNVNWYDAPTGGNLLATGNNFTTPSLSVTTNYWVDATTATCTTSTRTMVTATVIINSLSNIKNIVCQNETVTYSLPCSYDSLAWTITGGTPTSSSSPTINVTWGTGNRGWVKVEKFNSGVSQGIDSARVYIDQVSNYTATPNTTICNGSNINLSLNYTNKSLQFNGTTDYVGIANSNLINLGNTDYRTVMLWFKANDNTTRQVLYNEGGGNNGLSIYIENGNVYCLVWESNTPWTPVYTAINTGQWYHIAFVFDQDATDGTHFKGYLNGNLIASYNEGSKADNGINSHSGSVEIANNLANIRFHDNSRSSNNYFNGKIDGFKLWNRSLSANEIPLEQYHWLSTPVIDAALDVYINFDNTVLDQANPPSGEDGALYGNPVYSDDVPLSPSLLWTPGNLTTQTINVSPTTTTNYKVKLTELLSNYCADSTTITVTVATVPTITSTTPGFRCGTGTVTLSATASVGIVKWYSASSGGSLLGTGTNFTTPSIASTTSYWVEANNNGCISTSRTQVIATINNTVPTITGTTPNTRCGNGSVTLGASASAGTVNWYTVSSGGSAIGTGTTFNTPSISSTTTYWVDATYLGCTTASRTSVVATVNSNPIGVSATVGTLFACYTTLKTAFDAINAGTHRGVINILIGGNTTETATAVLNASGTGSANYTSINISPDGGVNRIISGGLSAPIIDLNGADNLTIDGLNTGGNSLRIQNLQTTSGSAVRFIADATNNTITNCTVAGCGNSATTGVIVFSTGTTNGNDDNTISNCNLTAASTNLPANIIYSAGTSARENDNISIINNNISDYFQAATTSTGILISSNSTNWIINNNKFFQSAARGITANSLTHRAIQILTGNGYTINDNIIGFADENGTGVTSYFRSNGSTTPLFRAIELTVGIVTASSVQNNTITAISLSTNSATTTSPGIFSGISILAGSVNVGTITGNTIGASTGNAAISIVSTVTAGLVTGIYATSVGTVNIQNNNIGGFDLGGPDAAIGYTFNAISTVGTNGIFTISNNTIGSITTANSISVGSAITTTGVNTFRGILNAATGAIAIENNIIQNCTSYGTAASAFYGVDNNGGSGVLNINNNQVIEATNTGTGAMIIYDNSTVVTTLNINNNIVRNITKTAASGTLTLVTTTSAITSQININNNQFGNTLGDLVTYTTANSAAFVGITVTTATNTSALTITGNDFRGINFTNTSTSAITFISNTAATLSQNIRSNTFTDLNVKTTGTIIFITNSVVLPSGGSETTNNNSIIGTFTRDATSGAMTLYTNTATSNANSTATLSGNNFSNITVSGTATIAGWVSTDASTNSRIIDGNTFANWQGGTGAITALTVNLTGVGNQTKNNTIRNLNCACTLIGITTGAGNDNIFSNTIDSLTTEGGVVATTISGINVSTGTTKNIYSNSISNITGNTLTTGSVRGIAVSGGTTINLYQNTIFGLSANAITTGTINGIWVSASTTATIDRNKIFDLTNYSSVVTTGVVYGIQISGSTASTTRTIVNNFIGDLKAPNANSTSEVIRGIGIISTGATSNNYVYYNTIFINASSIGTNFSTTGLYHTTSTTATTSTLHLRNNIINNSSTQSGTGYVVAFRRSNGTSGTLANYASASNNNLFYAGVPGTYNLLFYNTTNNAQTITQYKQGVFTAGTISPRDQLSVSEDMLSSGAFLSTDPSDPDFLKINPAAVTLVESGAVNISGITTDNGGTIRHGNPGYSGTGTAPDIGADEVDSYVITSLSGTYNVGTGQTFTSLTRGGAIFSLINNRGLSGNVIINITSDLSENGVEPLSQWAEYGGSGYTITIKSSAAVVRNITGTVNNGLIRLNGADRVLIDGSVGGSGRYLRFSNTNTGTSAATFTFLNDATNDTIKNCIIEGSTTNSVGGVVFFSTTNATTGNDDNVVTNNIITNAGSSLPRYAIYSAGTSLKTNSTNTISNNEISNFYLATATTSGINIAGNNSSWTISGNKIFQTATRLYTTGATHYGITITSGDGYTITDNIIGFANNLGTGTTNLIGNSVDLTGFPSSYTTTGTANATRYVGINCTFTAAGTVSSIQNNIIGGFALYTSSSTATANGMWCGIAITAGNANIGTLTGNTIGSITGQNSVYAVTTTTNGAAVGIYTTTANTINIQNNIVGGINSIGTINTVTGNFTGIDVAGVGSYTISNNLIGNTTESNIRTGNLLEGANLSNTGSIFQQTSGTSSAIVGIRSSNTGNSISITNNTLRGFATSTTNQTFTGITTSGTMTGSTPSVLIDDNYLGTASTSLINYTVANSGTLTGINISNTIATTYSIQRNNFRGINHLATGSNTHNYIVLAGATSANAISNINTNTFTNLNVNTTGQITFITNSVAIPSTGTQNVNGNSIVGSFTRSAASGNLYLFNSSATTVSGGVSNHNNNNFSYININGSASNLGWVVTDAGDASRTFQNNTFSNWVGGSGSITAYNVGANSTNTNISTNIIRNISSSGSITAISAISGNGNITNNTIDSLISSGSTAVITGISISSSVITNNVFGNTISNLINSNINSSSINGISTVGGGTVNIYQNTIYNLIAATTTTGTINGISIGGSAGNTFTVYRNKIYDLTSNGTTTSGGTVNGISVTTSIDDAQITLRNNIIGNLSFPQVSSTLDVIRGLHLAATGPNASMYVYYNTVVINATSTGANFSTTGVYHLTNTTFNVGSLDLRNNIISNSSTPKGTGLTVAYLRSSTDLNNYSTNSNNNLYFAGTPSSSNLIFYDGTNADQTLTAFKSRMTTRDALSISENLITNLKFLSLTGSSSSFLMMNPSKGSAVESGARNIAGVTIDYNGNTRQGNAGYSGTGTYPDIGASEYNGLVCSGLWTGFVSSDWNNISNWDCEIPTSSTNVTIPNGLSYYPILNSGTGIANNITIASSASITINGGTLQVAGNITNNGSLSVSSGYVEFNGSTAQTISNSTFASNTIPNLIINNTSGVTLNGQLNIIDELIINNGRINTNGNIVLKSSSAKTARIPTILSSDPTPINGNITMERYIPGRRKYRLLTSSVTTSPLTSLSPGQESLSIWGNWQNSGDNVTANVGTIITGGSFNDGFDQHTSTPSVFNYDDIGHRYISHSTLHGKNTKYTPLKAGVAYYFFVYGDRLNTASASSPNHTILKATGTVLTGDQNYTINSTQPLTNIVGDYTFLGNPFASPIDWATLPKTNLENTYWGWDPNLSSTGGYITVNTSGGVTLIAPFSGTVGLNQYIQSGQGFFVRTAAANPTLTIREIDKVSDYNTNAFRGPKDLALIAVNLFYKNNGNSILADGAIVAFDSAYNNDKGKEDANKFFTSNEGLAIKNNNELFSIDARNLPQAEDSIVINNFRLTKPQYSLQIFLQNFEAANVQPFLEDKYLNTLQSLSITDTNWINFNVNANDAASFNQNRFKIVFKNRNNLPGMINNISATRIYRKIQVDYKVENENNVAKYELQKSNDGVDFSLLATINPKGDAPSQNYQFIDEYPLVGKNYYRIKLVSNSNLNLLSKVAVVDLDEVKGSIYIFPNPIIGKSFNVNFKDLNEGNYTIQIINSFGKIVENHSLNHTGSNNNYSINFKNTVSSGTYIVRVVNESILLTQKVIINN
ncbi:MAG: hypothetical protein KGZ59_03820 [Chitinophagaceae bacterium]|nr:hypothetical protein [Chitinophagaceae bacterium]